MGKWKYRKPEPSDVRGLCVVCGVNPQKKNTPTTYKPTCSPCNKKLYATEQSHVSRNKRLQKNKSSRDLSYRYYKKDSCEECGFKAEDPCQLDIDHVDNDRLP